MLDAKARERAEILFERNEKREGEISDALKQEAARAMKLPSRICIKSPFLSLRS
jgi:hypothetical protein